MSWNVQSIIMKIHLVLQVLSDNNVDIACIQETWLSSNCNAITAIIREAGYNISHVFRTDKVGTGTAILWKNKFDSCKFTCKVKPKLYESLQYQCVVFKFNPHIVLINIYRLQEVHVSQFFKDLEDLIDSHFNFSTSLVLTGDFNIHFEKDDFRDKILLSDLTSSFGLSQLVQGPTNKHGHTIDLLFLNSFEINNTKVQPVNYDIGDHFPILFECMISNNKTMSKPNSVCYRNIKGIDLVEFSSDLCSQLENINFQNNFSNCYEQFSAITNATLDVHAPLITKSFSNQRDDIPWQDAEYKKERALRRKLERKWKESANNHGPERFSYFTQRSKCVELSTLKRSQYYSNLIKKNEGDTSSLFNIVLKLLDKQKSSGILPHFDNPENLANKFNNFYTDKVKNIRDGIPTINSSASFDCGEAAFTGTPLENFEPTTVDELRKIITASSVKTAYNDLLPSKLLKSVLDSLLPHICNLVNLSLSTGSMEGVKESTILPLLKKVGLDPEILKNYRPISDLVFISRLIERTVLKRLNLHTTTNNLQCNYQHGYKKYHSTETLVLKVVNDILVGFDSKTCTILLLLDLSAAFDTVDIEKLLFILEHEFGIKGMALTWFRSFLLGRTQRVRVQNSLSGSLDVLFGVPQGSVLGPVLFNMYTRSLYNIISDAGFSTSGYADDSNARISFPTCFQLHVTSEKLPQLMDKITNWMNRFFLKINPDKTEIILFQPTSLNSKPTINGTILSTGECIRFSEFVKNLGVILDRFLNFEIYINSIVSHSFKLLKDISSIRNLISVRETESLVHAVITSRLDYCNSLFYNLRKSDIEKLQKVQNAAARVVLKLRKRVSVRAHLVQLHWLRVEERIVFKLLVTIFKCLNGMAPVELSSLINVNNAETCTLKLVFKDTVYGRRSFQYVAPRLWNALPTLIRKLESLESFKSNTKYHLFNHFADFMRSVTPYT